MKVLLALSFALSLAIGANAQTKTITIISEQANLRGTPSPQGEVVDKVVKNEVFELITSRGAWFLVQSERYVGWLHGNTIKLNSSAVAAQAKIVEESARESGSMESARPRRVLSPAPSTPTATTVRSVLVPVPEPSVSPTYITGERGGCYYINSNGNKTYVDRSLCGSQPLETTATPNTTTAPSSTGAVNVRGYYRKDGTYVRPHTRSAPRRN